MWAILGYLKKGYIIILLFLSMKRTISTTSDIGTINRRCLLIIKRSYSTNNLKKNY